MKEKGRSGFVLEDAERNRLHATWSRSGKRLILTISSPKWDAEGQVELTEDEVERVTAFLVESKPR